MIPLANCPLKLTVREWQEVHDGLSADRRHGSNLRRVIRHSGLLSRQPDEKAMLLLTVREKQLVDVILNSRALEEAGSGSSKG